MLEPLRAAKLAAVSKQLVIFGVGEFAEIAHEYFTHDSQYDVVAFCADMDHIPETGRLCGLDVVDAKVVEKDFPTGDVEMFVAIPATNLNRNRRSVCARMTEKGYRLASYVSSRAFVWRNASIGENCFIFESNVVQPFVSIGNRCVLWSGNHIGHRTVIEDDVFITSHVVVSGYCTIGRGSFLGVNATVNDGITVGEECVIGAASHVTRRTQSGLVYVGAPAKPLPGKTSDDVKL